MRSRGRPRGSCASARARSARSRAPGARRPRGRSRTPARRGAAPPRARYSRSRPLLPCSPAAPPPPASPGSSPARRIRRCAAARACRWRTPRPPPPRTAKPAPPAAARPAACAPPGWRRESLASFEQLVGGEGEELHELAQRELVEDLARFLQMGHALQLPELVVAELLVQGPVDLPAVRELRLVLHPLPELCAGDLRGGRVLHQVEDRRRAVAGEPGGQILQRHGDVVAHPVLGDRAARHARVLQLARLHPHLLALALFLVRLA